MKYILGYLLFRITNFTFTRRNLPMLGRIVEELRQEGLRLMGARIERGAYVRGGAVIDYPKNFSLGAKSKLAEEARLYLFDSLNIGNNVEIGPQFLAYTAEHITADKAMPLTKQGSIYKAIRIDDDVYIGARVTILKGAHIESRVIVAAGAVVVGKLETGFVYGGVPAKKIKPI